jgi:pimeloyl-ACP methyl ester carboxylesterase
MSTIASLIPSSSQRRIHKVVLWLKRIGLGLLIIMILLCTTGFIYQAVATEADKRSYPPPGQLIDVGGYRLHLYCVGEGSPTVILDAAFPAQVSNWVWVQSALSPHTQVCAYDRAGHGWSDPGPEPRDAMQHARELHALLTNANVPGPYILVGHSLGGLYVRMFADLYPNEIAGMVLIEGSHPDAWKRLGLTEGVGVDSNMLAVAPSLARFGIFRLRLFPVPLADADLPPQQRDEEQAYFDSAKYFDTLLAVNTVFPLALEQVRQTYDLGSRPLIIVIGGASDNVAGLARELQDDLAQLSSNSATRVVDGATHSSLVDQRDHALQTSATILEVLEAVRTSKPLAQK